MMIVVSMALLDPFHPHVWLTLMGRNPENIRGALPKRHGDVDKVVYAGLEGNVFISIQWKS